MMIMSTSQEVVVCECHCLKCFVLKSVLMQNRLTKRLVIVSDWGKSLDALDAMSLVKNLNDSK